MELTEKTIEETAYFELSLAQTDEVGWEEQGAKDVAQAIFERLKEGMVWSTVHVNLQKEDGQFWLDLGPLGTLGPIVLPPDMEDADPVALTVRRLNGDRDGNNARVNRR